MLPASRAEPLGLVRKRTFETEGNTILDFTDVLFGDADADETPDEFLLRELARKRTGTLRDVVATIQVAQFDIIRQPADQILIIEGGPGTGKTVIALHRVSWLLQHHPELSADGVLVVGPHPTFIRYIREVLPELGDVGVELRDFFRLAPAVQRGRSEPVEVARLKGDARIAPLLARALGASIREVWSDADLPMLDELEHLINGTATRYAHIVADEAQDLSPMQLRSLARRSKTGSMTIIGDLAQSTGPWARDRWSEVTSHLPTVHPVHIETLRYGYRVPRQAYEFASRLLPVAAPGVRPPVVVRDGPDATVHKVRVDDRARQVVAVAMAHANHGRFVGIVFPTSCRREVDAVLAAGRIDWSSAERGELGSAINLVSPQEAKGLEFDAVIVVEPEHIVAEHRRGDRMLYVALTRTTGHLDIVCVGEPVPLSAPGSSTKDGIATCRTFDRRDVLRHAESGRVPHNIQEARS